MVVGYSSFSNSDIKVWEFFILQKFRAQMQLMFISILRRVAMAAYNFFQCILMLRVVPVAYLNLSL